MFKKQIEELAKPSMNQYKDDRDKFAKRFNLMTEDSSGFESIIKEMNTSQNIIDKVKITKCENPNCKTAFTIYEQCKSCNRTFCSSCLTNCESCAIKNCKFCIRVLYTKFKDTNICQNC